jgi:hypothetical protein
MEHAHRHRRQILTNRSSNLALDPYLIEETTLTRCELEHERSRSITFVVPR